MERMAMDYLLAQEEMTMAFALIGVALGINILLLWAVGYAYGRHRERQKIEAASARVLQSHPEFAQTNEDFRAFARKVCADLGWDSVSFTYS
jgi:hypothetical protein